MPLSAQIPSATGRVAGVLKDQSGAVMPGVKIEIKNLESGRTEMGRQPIRRDDMFSDRCPVGRYQVSAASSGFEPSVRNDITVTADRETTVDFVKLAMKETVVEVTASAVTVSSEIVVPGGPDQRYSVAAQRHSRPGPL